MRGLRWLMVIATAVVLVINGFNPMNARVGDWLILGGITYAVFFALMIMELISRTLTKFMVIPALGLMILYPLVVAPWVYNSLQAYWPEGDRVVVHETTDFQVETRYEGLSTYAYVTNNSEHLLENATVTCDVYNLQGDVIETVRMQIGIDHTLPGEITKGRVLGGGQYAVRGDAIPQKTMCRIDRLVLVQN